MVYSQQVYMRRKLKVWKQEFKKHLFNPEYHRELAGNEEIQMILNYYNFKSYRPFRFMDAKG